MNEIKEKIIEVDNDKQDRRVFLKQITNYLIGFTALYPVVALANFKVKEDNESQSKYLHEAAYYSKLIGDKTKCLLCPNTCTLYNGQTGKCLIRRNIKGKLYTTDFGHVKIHPSKALDFANFPLTGIWVPHLDIAEFAGCALKCSFCVFGEQVQTNPESINRTNYYSPEAIIAEAEKRKINGICFTASEPAINFEYTLAVARLAKQHHIKVVLTTGGYVNPGPFTELLQYVDIVFFSFKGFSNTSYQKYTEGDLKIVLKNLKQLKKYNKKTEILYVVIPTISDNMEDIRAMSLWVKENLGEYTPVHFIRYWPSFKLKNLPQTSLKSIKYAMEIARKEGLKYVLPFAHFISYDLKEIINANFLTLTCPHCGDTVAKVSIKNDNAIILTSHFGKNHSCGTCGKDFLSVFMK